MSSNIDLNKSFPMAADGSQGPLPKQKEFMRGALHSGTPKYIAYVGGVGSGKTLIGCVTVLSWAVMYPGDYLISRQFMPELKVTTYKTFLEVCPPELILENRVADMTIRIKCANGKSSLILFRQLDEPDKLRSLNLSGFYIDEANQTSEEAFMLLQGRLRGSGIRKGILTTNPKGHDWIYRWFQKKDHFKEETAKEQYKLIKAPSTENVHLPEGYIESLMGSWSQERIDREVNASWDAFEGMVYHEFRRDIHVVRPFKVPDNWDRHIRIDHGYRAPTAVIFAAISPDGDVYVYKEIYEKEWLIREVVLGNPREKKLGLKDNIKGASAFRTAKIDPSTKRRTGKTGESDFDEYLRHWPKDLPPLGLARNDVQLGIDRVKSYLKVHPKLQRPMLYIFETCTNLLEEISTYKYPELKPSEQGNKNEKENPIKANDHALDALRYLIVDLPEPYKVEMSELERKKKYTDIERKLQDEIRILKAPKDDKDPFSDGI